MRAARRSRSVRAFVAYAYPWHLARVGGDRLARGGDGGADRRLCRAALRAGLAARLRRPPPSPRCASLLLVPWYDLKALGAILAGVLALARLRGARRCAAGRPPQAAICRARLVGLMAWQRTAFLDQAYYLLLAAMLIALVAEQVPSLRRARAERDAETRAPPPWPSGWRRAEREGEPIVALKDGSRTHRVAEGDILFVRAADDYCDVALKDGRTLLVTMTLARLPRRPPGALRPGPQELCGQPAHVVATAPARRRTLLTLSEGTEIPVGRSYENWSAAGPDKDQSMTAATISPTRWLRWRRASRSIGIW